MEKGGACTGYSPDLKAHPSRWELMVDWAKSEALEFGVGAHSGEYESESQLGDCGLRSELFAQVGTRLALMSCLVRIS